MYGFVPSWPPVGGKTSWSTLEYPGVPRSTLRLYVHAGYTFVPSCPPVGGKPSIHPADTKPPTNERATIEWIGRLAHMSASYANSPVSMPANRGRIPPNTRTVNKRLHAACTRKPQTHGHREVTQSTASCHLPVRTEPVLALFLQPISFGRHNLLEPKFTHVASG